MFQIADDHCRLRTLRAVPTSNPIPYQRASLLTTKNKAPAVAEEVQLYDHKSIKPASTNATNASTSQGDNNSSNIMFNSIGDVLQLMVVGDWKTFESAVLSNPALFRYIAGAVSSCSQLNGMTMLHAAVRYNPPLNIVAQMIRICPDMPATEDCLHRTPLHVAAGSRASASLIKLLACACPSACDVQDVEGKTPLHFACDSSCVLFEEDHDTDTDDDPPNHKAIAALLLHSTNAVTLEDDEEMSPLEHAIMSNASMETVKLLQRVSRQAAQIKEGLQSFISATKCLHNDIFPDTQITCYSNSRRKIRRITLGEH